MNIEFNKNLELIYGLLYSVNKDYHTGPNNLYTNEIKSYCNEFYNLYKNYASPELVNYIKNGGLDTYYRSAYIALSFDENYNIIENNLILQIKKKNKHFSKQTLEKEIKKFVNDSNYEMFYEEHTKLYNYIINQFRKSLNKYLKFNSEIITKFYGFKLGDMKLYLYNFTTGSMGIGDKNNLLYIQRVENINSDEKNIEFKDNKILNFFHEFSHPYMNYFIDKHMKNIKFKNLYDYSVLNGLNNCYQTSNAIVAEYCVRSAQIYLGYKYLPKNIVKLNHKKQIENGFNLINNFIYLYDKKDLYETFDIFFEKEIVSMFLNLEQSLKIKNELNNR